MLHIFRANKMNTAYTGDKTNLVPSRTFNSIGDVYGTKSSYAGAARQVKREAHVTSGIPRVLSTTKIRIPRARSIGPRQRFM